MRPDGSAQLLDAEQVAGRIPEGAVADAVRLIGRLLDHLRFASQEDAKVFIDLIMSYRDRLKKTWSGRK